MGFLDRLFGSPERAPRPAPQSRSSIDPDAQAIERYRYMVKTAPPETLEQAHQEAFEKLTPEQRSQVLGELVRVAPAHERAAIEATPSEDPRALARVATRAEVRDPGVVERTLGGAGARSNLLGSFAAGFVGSLVAQSFFSAMGGWGGEESTSDEEASADPDADGDDGGYDDGGDMDI